MVPDHDLTVLRASADHIPELGGGGKRCAEALVSAASEVPPLRCIVDIGPWMGSTTAYLALGTLKTRSNGLPYPTIYSFDVWRMTNQEFVEKCAKKGFSFHVGEDFKIVWASYIRPFAEAGAMICPTQGDVMAVDVSRWTQGPIGLLVDDCSAGPERLEKFAPLMPRGALAIHLDYNFKHLPEVRQWVDHHQELFVHVWDCPGSTAAVLQRT